MYAGRRDSSAKLFDGEGMGRAHGVAAHTLKHGQIPEPLPLRSLRSWAHVGTGAHDRRGVAGDDGGGGGGGRRLCGGAAAAFTPAPPSSAAAVAARVAPAPIARSVAAVHARLRRSFARWPPPRG